MGYPHRKTYMGAECTKGINGDEDTSRKKTSIEIVKGEARRAPEFHTGSRSRMKTMTRSSPS